ncbi:MAG: flagellin [Thermoguttaceae bacterium]
MTGLYVASNVKSLGAQITLQRNVGDLGDVLTRLSTGLRINSAKDDPAGLIASELLKSDITATKQAIKNTQRANGVIAVADSALGQVSNLLNDIRGLVNAGASTGGMSDDQIAANQLQIDASIDSIDRIANTTTFQGKKLLDGSMDFRTTNTDNTKLSNVKINAANFSSGEALAVKINLLETARTGQLNYNGTGVSEDTVIQIGGSTGSEIFKFGANTTNAEMAEAINRATDSTGVAAYVEGAAARGSVTLSSAGAANDIVITSTKEGYDAGNYAFRIVQGATNDAKIVSSPNTNGPGVVEITLQQSNEATFRNFVNTFDVTINTGGTAGAAAAVSITRGNENRAFLATAAQAATGQSQDGLKTLSVNTTTGTMSNLNGWTVNIGSVGANSQSYDYDAKTVTLGVATATTTDLAVSLAAAATQITGGTVANTDVTATAAATLVTGDSFKLGNGASAGELVVTYKSGATADDIVNLMNTVTNVSAGLSAGVSGSALIPDVPTAPTRVAGTSVASATTANATAQQVIDLINGKLGNFFEATGQVSEGTSQKVSFMNASATYGDVNLDNALRFTGMDSGPIVRMVTTDAEGKPIANQQLSVSLINPSEADIAAGVNTKILQINLATDAAGNSTTTAAQLADFFDTLTAAQTGGISVEVLPPPGVDPNGRTWVTDACGVTSVVTDCNAQYGLGVLKATGVPGVCEITQNDIVLLGENQTLQNASAVARIASAQANDTTANAEASSNATIADGMQISFTGTSAMNGVSFNFTSEASLAGFDANTGRLTVYLDAMTLVGGAATDVAGLQSGVEAQLNGAIKENWADIREYTGAVGSPVTGTVTLGGNIGGAATTVASGVTHLLTNNGVGTNLLSIPASGATGTAVTNVRGTGATDPALVITAKKEGTSMSGVKVMLVQDSTLTAGVANSAVDFDAENGILTIRANSTTPASAYDLANALNANSTFNALFTAAAPITNDATGVAAAAAGTTGTVAFTTAYAPAAEFVGGLNIVTAKNGTSVGANLTGTSAGIVMTGQSDANERLVLKATESGSANFVNVNVIDGSFRTFCPLGYEMSYLAGTDANITVNGQKAVTSGNDFSVSTGTLDLSGTLSNNMKAGDSTTFDIVAGGATFQLGPDVVTSQQIRISIPSVSSVSLGGNSGMLYQLKSGGNADLSTNTKLADKIVQEAISSVTNVRGRLGAIQRSTLEPNISALQDTVEQLSSAEALISNADFAEESSRLTRAQILVQSGAQALSLANQMPQYAAQLVR